MGVGKARASKQLCALQNHTTAMKNKKAQSTAAAPALLQVVDEVAHAGGLGFEVSVVVLVGRHLNGDACLHLDTPGSQPVDLERVVGHEPDALETMNER